MPRMPRKPRAKSELPGSLVDSLDIPRFSSPRGLLPENGRAICILQSYGMVNCGRAGFCTVGDTPSKKNSRKLVCRGSRPFSFPSDSFERWHRANLERLEANPELYVGTTYSLPTFCELDLPLVGVKAISIDLWSSTARLADCSNKAESVLDLLVDTAIIADDNWREVPTVVLAFNGVDREEPRAEVNIFYAAR